MTDVNHMVIQRTATVAEKNLKTLMVKIATELEIIAVMQGNIDVLSIAYVI